MRIFSCTIQRDDTVNLTFENSCFVGGLGVLYKGVWRGCDVAVKRPVDPRSAMDPELKVCIYVYRYICIIIYLYAYVYICIDVYYIYTYIAVCCVMLLCDVVGDVVV